MTIACAFRWGVALVGFHYVGHCLPHRGTPFQVQGMCRETTPLEADIEKKVRFWFLYFVKHVLECLILIYVLYKSDVI